MYVVVSVAILPKSAFGWLIVNLCRLLNEAQGSLLDDEQLLITLQTSKATSQDIKEQLETAEETEEQIDVAREVSVNWLGHFLW